MKYMCLLFLTSCFVTYKPITCYPAGSKTATHCPIGGTCYTTVVPLYRCYKQY